MTKIVLFLIGPEFEDLELFVPMYRLIEEGYEVVIASPNGGLVVGKHGYSIQTIKLTEVNPDEYVALVLPGGRGPERIRALARNEAVRIVKAFADSGKPIAAICHGPQLLISANIVKGRKITSYPGIADDVVNAGGFWINEPVVVDENIITSRVPEDLPYMMREFIKLLKGT